MIMLLFLAGILLGSIGAIILIGLCRAAAKASDAIDRVERGQ